jgi:hypothetical protein
MATVPMTTLPSARRSKPVRLWLDIITSASGTVAA